MIFAGTTCGIPSPLGIVRQARRHMNFNDLRVENVVNGGALCSRRAGEHSICCWSARLIYANLKGYPMSSFIKRAASHVYTVIAAVVILAAILLYARGVLAESQLSAALLAMFGTFLGALFAYRLNERREDIKLDNERKQELN